MDKEVQLFKALAEPVRLRILTLLLKGERCVCDLMAVLDTPQSTVSRHLAYLKNAGLISGQRQGVWMYYKLSEPKSELHSELITLLTSYLPKMVQAKKDLISLSLLETVKGEKRC